MKKYINFLDSIIHQIYSLHLFIILSMDYGLIKDTIYLYSNQMNLKVNNSLINYINDRDNRMLSSQIFFSLSELIPSYLYYKYLNRFENTTREIKPIKLSVIYPILFISVLHIYLASLERLLWGFFVTKFEDANRSRLRDFCLILNDLSGIILAIYWLFKENKDKKHNLKDHLFYIKSWTIICLFLYFFYYFFCSFEH